MARGHEISAVTVVYAMRRKAKDNKNSWQGWISVATIQPSRPAELAALTSSAMLFINTKVYAEPYIVQAAASVERNVAQCAASG